MIACMGGWCRQRERCARYVSGASTHPVDRLCERGSEQPEPLRTGRRFKGWIATAEQQSEVAKLVSRKLSPLELATRGRRCVLATVARTWAMGWTSPRSCTPRRKLRWCVPVTADEAAPETANLAVAGGAQDTPLASGSSPSR